MRNLSYRWNDVLEESVPRTMIGLKLLAKEKETERKEYEKISKKRR